MTFRVFLLIVFLLHYSCKNKSEKTEALATNEPVYLTDQHLRNIFLDSIAILNEPIYSFDRFIENYYPNEVDNEPYHPYYKLFAQYILEEEFSSTIKKIDSVKMIRVFAYSYLGVPFCMKLERRGKMSYLTNKSAKYLKDKRIPYLNIINTRRIEEEVYTKFQQELILIDLEKVIKDTTTVGVTDGFILYFEAFENGKYKSFEISNPHASLDSNTLRLWNWIIAVMDSCN